MATPFPLPAVTAAQVGTYFVGQYYQVLQQQPDFVHQFYSDASTMLRIDGNTRETATGMLQIHRVVMSLSYTGVEIKTAHSLESWNGGVLVVISGSVLVKDFHDRRKFAQTFFLAPQENGFFVLNDIFHFVDDTLVHHHSAALLAHGNLESKLNASNSVPEPVDSAVTNYMLGGEIQTREFASSPTVKENGQVDKYSFPVQQLQQQVPVAEIILQGNPVKDSNGSLPNTTSTVSQDHSMPATVEEPYEEPQKHTYASILRVPKGQSAPSVAPQSTSNKNASPASEWKHTPQPTTQQSTASSNAFESSGAEVMEDNPALQDEGEIKSVYVRNLPPTISASEIEEEFRNFGKLIPDGVVIRSRQEFGICYAFVEFEDTAGVQNAIKASPIELAGRQIHIEERRANSINSYRGGRRGRGRGGYYQTEAPRGRYVPRGYSRGNGQNGGDRDYNRPRANGFHRQGSRQDKGFSGNQVLRNEQTSLDSAN